MKQKYKVVIGVIGTDIHDEGNKVIQKTLEENNFEVVNVGVLAPQIEFIYAALESNADAIIVSSIHGKAEFDYIGTRENCDKYKLFDILLYAGGNLNNPREEWSETEKRFISMGFNRVYPSGTPIEKTLEDLKNDLKLKHGGD